MACKREDRFRHNTIAFWLSDEEKAEVEAKIILSGVPKGEYYRKAVLGQEITVVSGSYMSFRLSKVLEQICEELNNGNSESELLLMALVKELIAFDHEYDTPKDWELKEINNVMNNSISGWEKISSHRFAEYGIQRGWRRVVDKDGFHKLPEYAETPFDKK